MNVPPLQRILMVEDEPDIQAVARVALETVGGFTLEVCNSGEEALDRIPRSMPQLVLMDVMMPRMDGPTTLLALRRKPETAAIPVIFMTAKVQPSEIEQFKSIGGLGVIPKPFDPMMLAATVRGIWEKSHDP